VAAKTNHHIADQADRWLRVAIHHITALAASAGLPLGGLLRPGISFRTKVSFATANNSLTIAPVNQVAGDYQPFANSLRRTLGSLFAHKRSTNSAATTTPNGRHADPPCSTLPGAPSWHRGPLGSRR
jgi:hypothetical protein